MHDEHPHHLLAQVPLTVSPFLSLPSATTLPYTYKSLPSTLPPSALDPPGSNNSNPADLTTNQQTATQKPAYVMSAGGHSAHPDDIIANCRALQAHLTKLEDDARQMVKDWDDRIKERELAEKRRVAPGWLDENVRLLLPERKPGAGDQRAAGQGGSLLDAQDSMDTSTVQQRGQLQNTSKEGEELDRAFGGLDLK